MPNGGVIIFLLGQRELIAAWREIRETVTNLYSSEEVPRFPELKLAYNASNCFVDTTKREKYN